MVPQQRLFQEPLEAGKADRSGDNRRSYSYNSQVVHRAEETMVFTIVFLFRAFEADPGM